VERSLNEFQSKMNQMLHSMHTDTEERHTELEHSLQCHLTALKNQEELVRDLEGKIKRDRVKFVAWIDRIQELEDEILKAMSQVHKMNGQIEVLSGQACHCNAPAVIVHIFKTFFNFICLTYFHV
jgi:chromosome segregation ATPase